MLWRFCWTTMQMYVTSLSIPYNNKVHIIDYKFFFCLVERTTFFCPLFSLRLVNTVFFFSKSDCKNIKKTPCFGDQIFLLSMALIFPVFLVSVTRLQTVYTHLLWPLSLLAHWNVWSFWLRYAFISQTLFFFELLIRSLTIPSLIFFIWNLSSLHMNELKIQNNHIPLLNLCIFLP